MSTSFDLAREYLQEHRTAGGSAIPLLAGFRDWLRDREADPADRAYRVVMDDGCMVLEVLAQSPEEAVRAALPLQEIVDHVEVGEDGEYWGHRTACEVCLLTLLDGRPDDGWQIGDISVCPGHAVTEAQRQGGGGR